MASPGAHDVTRKPYTGSCHCGFIKYVLHVTLPADPNVSGADLDPAMFSKIYRCNCTTCHKMGYMHCRPVSMTDDFRLLSPLIDKHGNAEGLGVYQCGGMYASWYFCQRCGCRAFTITKPEGGQIVKVNMGELMEQGSKGELKEAWKASDSVKYLSVNAVTIDAGQGDGLREWTERKWVYYLERFKTTGHNISWDRPFEAGMY
ncbi:hypothetical protein EJ05DRAFT_473269 [Pseudovirgaria hyperparasitica]|uniref:CENP-V/GFA domain-containing protein n=1 Tax=Pseudovirgaria hyperparasitica TaxID=470096 RepID=A0A6A6WK48_9PEZI|nr:uncharacterized protein EJ05DRAFT_473269 [Pseudovirgaria hyperparasitica]KAF2762361.1 hypothetical protein EJ05DRAFT_473269 [Pseudovirgaria hyperparasitica]